MIDWRRVSELKEDFGEEDFGEITELFLMEVEQKFETLSHSGSTDLSEEFHFLKGSAANLGFTALQDACAQAEKSPEASDIPKIHQIFLTSKEVFLSQVDSDSRVA